MRDWRRFLTVGCLVAAATGWAAGPAHAEDEIGPVGCAITYRQLDTLRRETLEPAAIRKRHIAEFEPFDFAAREAAMMELIEADPELDSATVDTLYSFVVLGSAGGFNSEFGMETETIVSTLNEGSKCDTHYELSPNSSELLRHFE